MPDRKKYYDVYKVFDHLEPGSKLIIEHHVALTRTETIRPELVALPLSELNRRRAASVDNENDLFEQLISTTVKWEEQAAITQLLDRAIEYNKPPAHEHSSNKWVTDKNGYMSISNTVYKMCYQVNEEMRYDHVTKSSLPIAWVLQWDVLTNSPLRRTAQLAGQDKRFTDKSAMEKYLNRCIAAYAHLFAEISPPIPRNLLKYFTLHRLLLPGYSVADNAVTAARTSESDLPRESVLERIAADKASNKTKAAKQGNEAPGKSKKRGDEEH
jgi:hypothetical protein